MLVECDAGAGSGFANSEYERAGAKLVDSHEGVFAESDMIVKVKEPIASEYDMLKPNQLLFTYLHLAAEEKLTRALMERKVQAVAYETVQLANGSLPLVDADERGRGPDVDPGRRALPGAHLRRAKVCCSAAWPGCPALRSSSSVAGWSAPTPRRWRSAWAQM